MRILAFCRQIGHYHAARFRALGRECGVSLVVVSITSEASFAEFAATERLISGFETIQLFSSLAEMRIALKAGKFRSEIHDVLSMQAPDLVCIAGWAQPESLEALIWCRTNRVPTVLFSESQEADAERSWVREWIKAKIVAQFDAALVGGSEHARYAERLGIDRSRIRLGYDVVDNDHFKVASERARADADAYRRVLNLPQRFILASCRFVPKKNLRTLIDAFATQASRNPNGFYDLVILGDGPLRRELENQVRGLKLEGRIFMPGFKKYEELPIYYGLAEAFAHVSLSEQWGLVVNEAAAAALPLIVSSSCGCASSLVVDGLNGFIVDPHSAFAVGDALQKMYVQTAERRRSMGTQSQAIVREWGPSRFAKGVGDLARIAQDKSRSRGPIGGVIKLGLAKMARREFDAVP
jgi:1,2-diacylglycerol 3-alpha-glucosyltransferase